MRSSIVLLAWLALALVGCKKDEAAQPAPAPAAGDLGAAAAPAKPRGTITVAAAADLTFAFDEVGKAFTAESGVKVDFVFGSTGQLAQKVGQGAPYDLLAAANVSFIDDLVKSGDCAEDTKAIYGRGRIVIWAKAGGAVSATTKLEDLTGKAFVKIAIANPEHAPYGKAAKQALEKAGLWAGVEKKIVYGENIKQTMQYAQTGNVEAAILALSLAIVEKDGVYAEIPGELHEPLDQAFAVCKHGKNAAGARAFATFVNSPAGRVIMNRYGFTLPGAAPAAPAAPAPAAPAPAAPAAPAPAPAAPAAPAAPTK